MSSFAQKSGHLYIKSLSILSKSENPGFFIKLGKTWGGESVSCVGVSYEIKILRSPIFALFSGRRPETLRIS